MSFCLFLLGGRGEGGKGVVRISEFFVTKNLNLKKNNSFWLEGGGGGGGGLGWRGVLI